MSSTRETTEPSFEPWPRRLWRASLDDKPRIEHAGAATHGVRRLVENYRLPRLWCLHFYSYSAVLRLDGEAFPIHPGHVSLVPPDRALEYHFRAPSPHLFAHFRWPSAGEATATLPAMQDVGDDFAALSREMRRVVESFAARPARAEAALWELLWRLSEFSEREAEPTTVAHPVLQRAMREIELRLSEPQSVAGLAREVGVSHNHLTRLFRAGTGATVTDYIRARRLSRARHLLLHSTLPIKAVATHAGFSDVQRFNKEARRAWGQSPRAVRAGHLSTE